MLVGIAWLARAIPKARYMCTKTCSARWSPLRVSRNVLPSQISASIEATGFVVTDDVAVAMDVVAGGTDELSVALTFQKLQQQRFEQLSIQLGVREFSAFRT